MTQVLTFFPIIIAIFTLYLLKKSIDERTKYIDKIDKELDLLEDLLSKLQNILQEFKHDTIYIYTEINTALNEIKQELKK